MKFFADENFSLPAINLLRDIGYDVLWARDIMPSAPDLDLLNYAFARNLIILTHDKDFGELAQGTSPSSRAGIVLFRLKAPTL